MIYANKSRNRITADTVDELNAFLQEIGMMNAGERSHLRLPPALYKKAIATGKVIEVDPTTYGKVEPAAATKSHPSKPSLELRRKLKNCTLEDYFKCWWCYDGDTECEFICNQIDTFKYRKKLRGRLVEEYFTKKIVVICECPPIPIRDYDWLAYYDGEEELGQVGYGKTQADAIADLKENYPPDM